MHKTILFSHNMKLGAIFSKTSFKQTRKICSFTSSTMSKTNRLFKLQRIAEPPTTCFQNAFILEYYCTQKHLILVPQESQTYRCCRVAARNPCRCIYHVHITLFSLWETNSGLTVIQRHMETESEITTDFIDQGINESDFHGISTS